MKSVFLDESTVNLNGDISNSGLIALGEITTYPSTLTEEETIERCQGATHIIVNKVLITEKVVKSLADLQHVAVIATGTNNVDLNAMSAAGMGVSNVPGYAKDCVPQHVFALILNLATKANKYHADIMSGEWQKSKSFTLLTYPTFELSGKTIGVIGFGAIGKGVAKIAEGFGMKVMMNNKSGRSEGGYHSSPLEKIYDCADVISLNCPLTVENKYMINAEVLQRMKSSAILINTARGPLVNQYELANALNSGEIAGAGIDVLDQEPPTDNPLLGEVKNLILTPHSAWSTVEARQRLIDEVTENIKASLKNESRNIVN